MDKKLIVFTHGGGRLANQMTNHAHWIAFQKEYAGQFEVIDLAFGPYSHLFEEMQSEKIRRIPSAHRRLKVFTRLLGPIVVPRAYKMTLFNVVLRVIHLFYYLPAYTQSIKTGKGSSFLKFLPAREVRALDLNHRHTINLFGSKEVTVVAGWPIRSWELFRKHQDTIRKCFAIRADYRTNAENFIRKLKGNCDLLVGVFIRQTDYRIWAGGTFFFTTAEYATWMKQVESVFEGKKIVFVVTSDEAQDAAEIPSLNAYFATGIAGGTGHFIESFAELSMCDYVMTPPSTFGVWAAFLGNIPIIPLVERNRQIKDNDFLKDHLFDCLKHPQMSVSIY